MEGRVVLHSDLNNCYASIECMLHPELRGKYIAVCGSTEDRHDRSCEEPIGKAMWGEDR